MHILCDDVLHRVVAFHGWRGAHRVLARVDRRWRAAVHAVVLHPRTDVGLVDVVHDYWLFRTTPPDRVQWAALCGAHTDPHAAAVVYLVLDGIARGHWPCPPALAVRPLLLHKHGAPLLAAVTAGAARLTTLEIDLRHPVRTWFPRTDTLTLMPTLLNHLWDAAPQLRRCTLEMDSQVAPACSGLHGPEVPWPRLLWRLALGRLVDLTLRCHDHPCTLAVWEALRPCAEPGTLRALTLRGNVRTQAGTSRLRHLLETLPVGLLELELDLSEGVDLGLIGHCWVNSPTKTPVAGGTLHTVALGLAGTNCTLSDLWAMLRCIGPVQRRLRLDLRADAVSDVRCGLAEWLAVPSCEVWVSSPLVAAAIRSTFGGTAEATEDGGTGSRRRRCFVVHLTAGSTLVPAWDPWRTVPSGSDGQPSRTPTQPRSMDVEDDELYDNHAVPRA